MKKTIVPLLAITLGLANISPIITNANEIDSTDKSSSQNVLNKKIDTDFESVLNKIEKDFNYEIITDEKTNIDTVNVTYNGEESITTIDYTTGEVKENGVLIGIIKNSGIRDVSETLINSELSSTNNDMSALASVPTYTIGTSSHGSGVYNYGYDISGQFDLISATATVTSAAALIISLLRSVKKPASTHLQIVSAASMLVSLINTSKTTFTWKLWHYDDKYNSGWNQDSLSFYRGTTLNTDTLKMKIIHYWGTI